MRNDLLTEAALFAVVG